MGRLRVIDVRDWMAMAMAAAPHAHRRRHGHGRRRRVHRFAELARPALPVEVRGEDVELAAEAEVGADDLALGDEEVEGVGGGEGVCRDEVCADDCGGARDAHRAVDLLRMMVGRDRDRGEREVSSVHARPELESNEDRKTGEYTRRVREGGMLCEERERQDGGTYQDCVALVLERASDEVGRLVEVVQDVRVIDVWEGHV